jgi:hypothetical protein
MSSSGTVSPIDGVLAVACGGREDDHRTMSVRSQAYLGGQSTDVDARELFARGGGVHLLTQRHMKLAE